MAIKKETKYKLYITFGLIIIFGLLAVFVLSGDNMALLKSVFSGNLSDEQLKQTLQDFGWRGYVTIIILSIIQVVSSCLPAEPVQVLSGLTFGFPLGLLLCCIGIMFGNTTIYLLHKTFGDKLRGFFVKKLHLDFGKISKSNRCVLIILILYILPAIPYGMICFFAATTNMSYRRYIGVTMLGSLPSACIGVGLGYIAIESNWIISVCVFAVLIVILIAVGLKRDVLFDKVNRFAEKSKKDSKNAVKNSNGFILYLLYYTFKIYYLLCGVKMRSVNKVGKVETPSIVLCNHGSFIDFIFAASILKEYKPNFVAARLYFYDKRLGWLIRSIGGFPKSMFAVDLESTRNCIRVLKNNNMLIMMPEARLSTAGRFEDIQETTYSFIKKSGVPVYTVKFSGDYFADPKWGKGFRRGSVVESELDILYTADEIEMLSINEIKEGVTNRLYYNEFEWIKERPEIKYKSSRMAEGLENILSICPLCKKKHTLTTRKNKIYCESCGYLTSIDNRYSFTDDFCFDNLLQWYDWQKDLLKEEIIKDDNYSLVSNVELRVPSDGKGLTRASGKGVCTLNRQGLTYSGTKDGEAVEYHFPIERVYRLLFGAGENFEIYNDSEILYFVPEEKRSAVDWYLASMILYDENSRTSQNQ